jgi:hypothetical protein
MDQIHETNRIEILGGYVVLSYFVVCIYAYDQYCQINNIDNELRYHEFLASLKNIINQNWVCGLSSNEYKELTLFVTTYGKLDETSEHEKSTE